MSNVTLQIGGRSYVVACADGEEAHVTGLANSIDARLAGMGDIAGQSEARVLLFAALLLADELHEAERRLEDAERQRDESTAALARPSAPRVSEESLIALAQRLENLAERLESAGANA